MAAKTLLRQPHLPTWAPDRRPGQQRPTHGWSGALDDRATDASAAGHRQRATWAAGDAGEQGAGRDRRGEQRRRRPDTDGPTRGEPTTRGTEGPRPAALVRDRPRGAAAAPRADGLAPARQRESPRRRDSPGHRDHQGQPHHRTARRPAGTTVAAGRRERHRRTRAPPAECRLPSTADAAARLVHLTRRRGGTVRRRAATAAADSARGLVRARPRTHIVAPYDRRGAPTRGHPDKANEY